jgi:phi13 family phage major tail protein
MAGIKFGLDKGYYAAINTESASAITYYTPVALEHLQQVVVNPITSSIDVPADNKIEETIYEMFGAEGSVQRSQMSDAEAVALLGYKKLGDTVVGAGEAPYVAFGYKRTATGGVVHYVWLLKTKFSEASSTADGKQPSSVNPQYNAFNFKSIRRACDNEWRIYVTKTFATAAEEATFDATWFSKATLEILYNAAVATNGKPSECKSVSELPATGVAGIIYYLTGATPGFHYWDGSAFVAITPLA